MTDGKSIRFSKTKRWYNLVDQTPGLVDSNGLLRCRNVPLWNQVSDLFYNNHASPKLTLWVVVKALTRMTSVRQKIPSDVIL